MVGLEHLISGQHMAVVSGEAGLWAVQSSSNKQVVIDYDLSRSVPPIEHSTYPQTSLLSADFEMNRFVVSF